MRDSISEPDALAFAAYDAHADVLYLGAGREAERDTAEGDSVMLDPEDPDGAAPRGFIVFSARRRVAQEGRLILTVDGRDLEVPGAPDMVIPRAGMSRNGH